MFFLCRKKWKVFKKEMLLSPKGSAWLAGVEMARGRDLPCPFMGGLSSAAQPLGPFPEEQAAILVTWYREGPNSMKRYLENRAVRSRNGVPLFPVKEPAS